MKKRREFLKKCGLGAVPFLTPALGLNTVNYENHLTTNDKKPLVNFIFDGLGLSPSDYIDRLKKIDAESAIKPDFYGNGGATKELEDAFAKLTGKEKAIYLPTGTMANQLAIKLLNGSKTKVIVPENSHIFRDEADAAQSVHSKRLIGVGKGKHFFDLEALKSAIDYTTTGEVFKSGLGTIAIENPVRRADGRMVPINIIKEISAYCKKENYKLHLDGARIHIAAAYSGVPVSEYASYFDTVYISLYKYLNAGGGAILCGDAAIIDQISHYIKIYGGTTFQSWGNTAMAMHYLEGIDTRWQSVVSVFNEFVQKLNKLEGIEVSSLENGTNIHNLKLDKTVDLKKMATNLYTEHNIWLGRANNEGIVKLTANESILTRDLADIVGALETSLQKARG